MNKAAIADAVPRCPSEEPRFRPNKPSKRWSTASSIAQEGDESLSQVSASFRSSSAPLVRHATLAQAKPSRSGHEGSEVPRRKGVERTRWNKVFSLLSSKSRRKAVFCVCYNLFWQYHTYSNFAEDSSKYIADLIHKSIDSMEPALYACRRHDPHVMPMKSWQK